MTIVRWLRRVDSNYRPLGYEPNELPTAPLRDVLTFKLYTIYNEIVNIFFAINTKNIFSNLIIIYVAKHGNIPKK